MNYQELEKKTRGLLINIGFCLAKTSDGKYEIRNQSRRTIAQGDLQTMHYCAVFMANDVKQNPKKYEAMNEAPDQNAMYQAGLAMSKKLNQGK